MSLQYNDYIHSHVNHVAKAYEWLLLNIPEFKQGLLPLPVYVLTGHDQSKWTKDEYDAYDAYFYGGNRSSKVVHDFDLAWLHHQHVNPHHWQYWILISDDEPMRALEMPLQYVAEMIADWWSFSIKSGDLYEIFAWYENHKSGMILHQDTRKLVEDILTTMRKCLDDGEKP